MNTRRAVATISVILTLVLITAAIALMSAYFAQQARRTRGVAVQAELRQLLLAATPAAQAALETDASPRSVPLVTPVAGAVIDLELKEGGTIIIRARLEQHLAQQTLHFQRPAGGRWTLADASLDRTQGQ